MRTPKIRKADPEAAALRAISALENPEVRKGFDDARNGLITDIESAKLDTEAGQYAALEAIRQLQALLAVKRNLLRPLAVQMVRQKAHTGTAR